MTGILGGEWNLKNFSPMGHIPRGMKLTTDSGESSDITASQLQAYIDLVAGGRLKLPAGPVFPFEKLRDAHRLMDENRANGKMVVVTG